jgi:hypothetical protein
MPLRIWCWAGGVTVNRMIEMSGAEKLDVAHVVIITIISNIVNISELLIATNSL